MSTISYSKSDVDLLKQFYEFWPKRTKKKKPLSVEWASPVVMRRKLK